MAAIERAHHRCQPARVLLVVGNVTNWKAIPTMCAVVWPHITCGQMCIQLATNNDQATARVCALHWFLETLTFVVGQHVQGTSPWAS